MKIWLDDLMDDKNSNRAVPAGFVGAHSVNEAIRLIEEAKERGEEIEMIDLDHDLGDYAKDGGDAIKLLDYLVEHEEFYPVSFHTSNPVGRRNMMTTVNQHWPEELHIYY
ncbi:MAG: hypothetical protein IKO32_00580 [Lachnospiraceae bacterium]|nr:hypothetical protein [Lachnospiraceae bacterium]